MATIGPVKLIIIVEEENALDARLRRIARNALVFGLSISACLWIIIGAAVWTALSS